MAIKNASGDRIRRSPRYPFVDLGRAIDQARALWTASGADDVGLSAAWKNWGYGANSSGGIQTEAALKQFGLLEVVGQGRQRRLKVSPLGTQILESAPHSTAQIKLIERAALLPQIHRHLWERWRAALPETEARRYLIEQRGFQAKGADALVKEYSKTMSFLASLQPAPEATDRNSRHQATPKDDGGGSNEFVDLRFEGEQLILSARVDRQGIPNLIKLLRANQELIGGPSKAKKQRFTRKPK